MSIALLERAASALDDLLEEVVFVGGATVGLWITDPAAPEPRPTKDVDVIVEVTSRGRFAEFEERLRAHGFREDQSIAAVPPPFLLATKLEAFASRGNEDYVGSRDMADVVSLSTDGPSLPTKSSTVRMSCATT